MTPDQQTPAEVVTADIATYGDRLIPGAAERLGTLWQSLSSWPADKRAEEISRRLDSPIGERYRNPAFDPKSEPDPVRAAVARHFWHLREGAVDELAKAWAPDLAGSRPDRIAGEVSRRINAPENAGYLRNPPPPPRYFDRLDALLAANFGDMMTPASRADLIAVDGRRLASMGDRQVIMLVAGSLKAPRNAERYGNGTPIAPMDPRLTGRGEYTTPAREPQAPKTSAPARDDSGRFAGQSAPAQPGRRRLFF